MDLQNYAGLLTAAQQHGAAHQHPQEFQVIVERSGRPIVCGRVRVALMVHKNLPRSRSKASTRRMVWSPFQRLRRQPSISSDTNITQPD